MMGCKTIPESRLAVNRVEVRGASDIDPDDVEDKLATAPSPKFLGLFRGVVYDYSIFDPFVFQRDMARVVEFYRTRGYYDAHARAGRIHRVDDHHVEVEVLVEEGVPVRVRRYVVLGLQGIPKDIAQSVERRVKGTLPLGEPFTEEGYNKVKEDARRALTDRGYAYATTKGEAQVDIVSHEAIITLTVEPKTPTLFGLVTIDGLGPLPEAPVRRALAIEPGTPYSQKALEDAQQAALDLGVFSAVEIMPELGGGTPVREVPIRVRVEPSRLRTIRLGVGVQATALASDVHALVGWENRNFLGGLRTFSVTWRPGVTLYPLRTNNIVVPDRLMPGSKLRFELQQPGLFEARTNGFIRPEFNIAPVLLDSNPPPDQPVIGYAESKTSIGVDRVFWKLYGALSHNVQIAYPFAYLGAKYPYLGLVTISYPELLLTLDLRNDKVHPKKGFFFSNVFQVAGGPFGGQARDVKIQPEARAYVPVTRLLTWATRASTGLLFPSSYGSAISNPPPVTTTDPSVTRDFQLTLFRGFFSGGPTQNRGYPIRGVSPQALVPASSPAQEAIKKACEQGGGLDCRVPTGGFTLWELSTELRYDVAGPLSIASFCDASDVSPYASNYRFKHPHLSCGGGLRYDTPVGPIRLDVGYRIPGLQVLGGLTRDEKEPDTFYFNWPIAISIGIGEAF